MWYTQGDLHAGCYLKWSGDSTTGGILPGSGTDGADWYSLSEMFPGKADEASAYAQAINEGRLDDARAIRRHADDRLRDMAARPVPVEDVEDGTYSCELAIGQQGATTKYWVWVDGGAVIAVAHHSGRHQPWLPREEWWRRTSLRYHLSHFPGFSSDVAVLFGSSGATWKKEIPEPQPK